MLEVEAGLVQIPAEYPATPVHECERLGNANRLRLDESIRGGFGSGRSERAQRPSDCEVIREPPARVVPGVPIPIARIAERQNQLQESDRGR